MTWRYGGGTGRGFADWNIDAVVVEKKAEGGEKEEAEMDIS